MFDAPICVIRMTSYKPIACSVYDLLEAAAVRRRLITLKLRNGNDVSALTGVITNIFAKDGEEFITFKACELEPC